MATSSTHQTAVVCQVSQRQYQDDGVLTVVLNRPNAYLLSNVGSVVRDATVCERSAKHSKAHAVTDLFVDCKG